MNPKNKYLNTFNTGKNSNALAGFSLPSLTGSTPKPAPVMTTTTPAKTSSYNFSSFLTPSNAGATGTKPTAITPPKTNPQLNTPAAQNYTQSLTTPAYGSTVTDSMGRTGIAKFDQNTGQALVDPNAPVNNTGSTSSQTSSPQSAYLKYLTGMFDEKTVGNARKSYEDSQQRLADIQSEREKASYDARKGYEATLDRPGGLKSGAQESAQLYNRRSNDDLNDLALQENAAARSAQVAQSTYNSYIDAGKSVYEAETAAQKATQDEEFRQKQLGQQGGFNLGEGETRYDAQGNKIAYGGNKTYAPGSGSGSITGFTGTLSPLAQAVQNGTITIDKIPMAQRAQIAAELATSGLQTGRQQALSGALDVVNSLLNTDTGKITGIAQNPLNFLGLTNAKALNEYNQLKGILSLENRQQLKGQGAISDFEFKILQDAASSLGRNLSNADFKEVLQKVKDVFEGKYRQTTATGPDASGDADYQAYLSAIGQ